MERDILPSLSDLVVIPALSPAFDAQWAEHGHLDAAVEHVRGGSPRVSCPARGSTS